MRMRTKRSKYLVGAALLFAVAMPAGAQLAIQIERATFTSVTLTYTPPANPNQEVRLYEAWQVDGHSCRSMSARTAFGVWYGNYVDRRSGPPYRFTLRTTSSVPPFTYIHSDPNTRRILCLRLTSAADGGGNFEEATFGVKDEHLQTPTVELMRPEYAAGVKLRWRAVGYDALAVHRIQRRPNRQGADAWEYIGGVTGANDSFTDPSPRHGVTNYYRVYSRVLANDPTAEHTSAAVSIAVPPANTPTAAWDEDAVAVQLTWPTAGWGDTAVHRVYRRPNLAGADAWERIANGDGAFADTRIRRNQTYRYRVQSSFTPSGAQYPSNEQSVFVPPDNTLLTAEYASPASVQLNWRTDGYADNTIHGVWRRPDANDDDQWGLINHGPGNNRNMYTDASVRGGVTYRYRVASGRFSYEVNDGRDVSNTLSVTIPHVRLMHRLRRGMDGAAYLELQWERGEELFGMNTTILRCIGVDCIPAPPSFAEITRLSPYFAAYFERSVETGMHYAYQAVIDGLASNILRPGAIPPTHVITLRDTESRFAADASRAGGRHEVPITWTAAHGVDNQFVVRRCAGDCDPFAETAAAVMVTGFAYTDAGGGDLGELVSGRTYTYGVRTVRGEVVQRDVVHSANTLRVIIPYVPRIALDVETATDAENVANVQTQLRWEYIDEPGFTRATHVSILRRREGAAVFTTLARQPWTNREYMDATAVDENPPQLGATYEYRIELVHRPEGDVAAVRSNIRAVEYTAAASALTLTATAASADLADPAAHHIRLRWELANPGGLTAPVAAEFEIRRRPAGQTAWEIVATPLYAATGEWVDTAVVAGRTYEYQISINHRPAGEFSTLRSVVLMRTSRPEITLSHTFNARGRPVLSWTTSADFMQRAWGVRTSSFGGIIESGGTEATFTHDVAECGQTDDYVLRLSGEHFSFVSAVYEVTAPPCDIRLTYKLNADRRPVLSWEAYGLPDATVVTLHRCAGTDCTPTGPALHTGDAYTTTPTFADTNAAAAPPEATYGYALHDAAGAMLSDVIYVYIPGRPYLSARVLRAGSATDIIVRWRAEDARATDNFQVGLSIFPLAAAFANSRDCDVADRPGINVGIGIFTTRTIAINSANLPATYMPPSAAELSAGAAVCILAEMGGTGIEDARIIQRLLTIRARDFREYTPPRVTLRAEYVPPLAPAAVQTATEDTARAPRVELQWEFPELEDPTLILLFRDGVLIYHAEPPHTARTTYSDRGLFTPGDSVTYELRVSGYAESATAETFMSAPITVTIPGATAEGGEGDGDENEPHNAAAESRILPHILRYATGGVYRSLQDRIYARQCADGRWNCDTPGAFGRRRSPVLTAPPQDTPDRPAIGAATRPADTSAPASDRDHAQPETATKPAAATSMVTPNPQPGNPAVAPARAGQIIIAGTTAADDPQATPTARMQFDLAINYFAKMRALETKAVRLLRRAAAAGSAQARGALAVLGLATESPGE